MKHCEDSINTDKTYCTPLVESLSQSFRHSPLHPPPPQDRSYKDGISIRGVYQIVIRRKIGNKVKHNDWNKAYKFINLAFLTFVAMNLEVV